MKLILVFYGVGLFVYVGTCIIRLVYLTDQLSFATAQSRKYAASHTSTAFRLGVSRSYAALIPGHKRDIIIAWGWLKWSPLWFLRAAWWLLGRTRHGIGLATAWVRLQVIPVILEDLNEKQNSQSTGPQDAPPDKEGQ